MGESSGEDPGDGVHSMLIYIYLVGFRLIGAYRKVRLALVRQWTCFFAIRWESWMYYWGLRFCNQPIDMIGLFSLIR